MSHALLDPIVDQAVEGALLRGRIDHVMNLVRSELIRAVLKHPNSFHNPHEAYGVIAEEFDEMLDEMRANDRQKFLKEAVQLAAMGARTVLDLGDDDAINA